jgi:predicted DNA-binding transcriptional regulator AlpA
MLLNIAEVAAFFACSTRTIERLRARGRFPAPVSLPGVRGNRWRRAAVEGYAAKLKTRRGTN